MNTKAALRLLARCLRPVLCVFDRLLPKRAGLWVFAEYGIPLFEDNARVLWCYLAIRADVTRIGLIHSKDVSADDASLRLLSVRGLWALYRSEVLVCTAGLGIFYDLGVASRRRVVVNTWHGVPVKGVMFAAKPQLPAADRRRLMHEVGRYTFTIASSEVDRNAMAACFQVPWQHVLVTGLPRNDWLVCPEDELPDVAFQELVRIRRALGGRRLLLAMPTFRDCSGTQHLEDMVRGLAKWSDEHSSEWKVVLRPHPWDAEAASSLANGTSLAIWTYRELANVQLALRVAEAVVCDYSSTWVDYMLLRRPMVGFVPDLEDYMSQRGLLYDYATVFPGVVCRAEPRLGSAVDEALSRGAAGWERSIRMFHAHQDGESCARVVAAIETALGRSVAAM